MKREGMKEGKREEKVKKIMKNMRKGNKIKILIRKWKKEK